MKPPSPDGGFMKSIPGVFKICLGLGATIYKDAWEVPAVFKLIQEVLTKR